MGYDSAAGGRQFLLGDGDLPLDALGLGSGGPAAAVRESFSVT